MTEKTETTNRASVKWVCIFNEQGIPLYWQSTSGQRRDGMDPPPYSEWAYQDGGVTREHLN